MDLRIFYIMMQLTTFLPMSLSQCSDKIEVNVDYKGDDIRYFLTDNIENCCRSCVQEAKCGIWTYVYGTKMCYLKYGNSLLRVVSSDRNTKLLHFNTVELSHYLNPLLISSHFFRILI